MKKEFIKDDDMAEIVEQDSKYNNTINKIALKSNNIKASLKLKYMVNELERISNRNKNP